MNTFGQTFARLGSSAARSEAANSRPLVSGAGECNVCPLRADVAQLVEQRFRKPQVTGSNPVVGSLDCGLRIVAYSMMNVGR
jgi:hypothetical protein